MKTMKTLTIAFGIMAASILLGIAGNIDYTETILYNMPQTAYENIVLKLGDDASDRDIVKEYKENKAYYDSLGD